MVYKKNQIIKNYEGKEIICNIETKAKRYTNWGNLYFDCSKCVNASWYEDNFCNNYKDVFDITERKRYCLNYKTESEE